MDNTLSCLGCTNISHNCCKNPTNGQGFREWPICVYNAAMRLIVLLLAAGAACAGETVVHNAVGYTANDIGVREFSAIVSAEDGRIPATGRCHATWLHSVAMEIAGIGDDTAGSCRRLDHARCAGRGDRRFDRHSGQQAEGEHE